MKTTFFSCFIFISAAFFSCKKEYPSPNGGINFGTPSTITDVNIKKSTTSIYYDSEHRFSKITYGNFTIRFIYSGANLTSCVFSQELVGGLETINGIQKIDFAYENKNKIIANTFIINYETPVSDTIFITDKGFPEKRTNAGRESHIYTFDQVSGNLIKTEHYTYETRIAFAEFEYDDKQGMFNKVNNAPWVYVFFKMNPNNYLDSSSPIYSPVAYQLFNYANNLIAEYYYSENDPIPLIIHNSYTYNDSNYPTLMEIGRIGSEYEINY
jgi:hypothetical protein